MRRAQRVAGASGCGMLPRGRRPPGGVPHCGHPRRGPKMPAERAAIVTGASSGIGLAIARVLGQEGFAMTVAARRPEKLEDAAKGLADEGFDVHAVAAHVSHEDDVKKEGD